MIRFQLGRWEFWLYRGFSFQLEGVVQRQRVASDCGYVQLAYGSARRYGLPAKRTVGLQMNRGIS